jgi:hypothetical protein
MCFAWEGDSLCVLISPETCLKIFYLVQRRAVSEMTRLFAVYSFVSPQLCFFYTFLRGRRRGTYEQNFYSQPFSP